MTLTLDDVRHLASLSQLSFSDDELADFLAELNQILHYVDKLQAVDTSGFEPTAQVTGLKNVMRDDVIEDLGANREALLANAPAKQDGYIKVKRVL